MKALNTMLGIQQTKIPAPKLVFWGRKIRNSIAKPFQMTINMMRMITQETLSGNGQDAIYLGTMGMNTFSGVILDLKPEQEAIEFFLTVSVLRKQQLVTIIPLVNS